MKLIRLDPKPANRSRSIRSTAAGGAILSIVLCLAAVASGSGPVSPKDAATDANITRLTSNLLEHSQFAHHPLDSELASKFLDRYLDGLDGTRSLFLQADVDGFATYRASLAQATRVQGDTSAAHTIFARYLERLDQRHAYVAELLKAGKFDFTGHDVYALDRDHAARPRDLTEARELWRQQLRSEYLQEKLNDKPAAQIATTLLRRDEQNLRTMKALRSDEVLEVYLNALAHVYDPHSDYLGREQMESFSIAMNLSLFGIGAALESEDGYTKIRELLPGGPAARSGLLKPGDRIVAVAQASKEPVDIINMPLTHAVELIRGPKGTIVTLTIIPAASTDGALRKTIRLVRDEINLEDQQAKAEVVDLPVAGGAPIRLGVIDLPSFYADMGERKGSHRRSATADVAKLLTKLKEEHVRGVVLDLRRNGGGSLEEAISLTGLFIKQGPVVQTKGPDGDIEVDADKDSAVLYDGPLVVLASRFSASASEILAGALQDYGRAVQVGDSSTFGKGTVQNLLPLASVMDQNGIAHAYDPGALKVTIRKFYRPDGASTQLKGVPSDIVLPSASDFSDVSESSLKDPLPWDSVPAAAHDRLNLVKPYVAALKQKSQARVTKDKEFAYLADDVAKLKKTLANKTVSLNEAERRKEMAEAKATKAARDKERVALQPTKPTTYQITLKNAGTPGLPPAETPKMAEAKATKAAAAASPTAQAGDTGSSDKDHSAANDVTLDEGLRILADYQGLLAGAAATK